MDPIRSQGGIPPHIKPFEGKKFACGGTAAAVGLLVGGLFVLGILASFTPVGDKLGSMGSWLQNHQAIAITGTSLAGVLMTAGVVFGGVKIVRSLPKEQKIEEEIRHNEPPKVKFERFLADFRETPNPNSRQKKWAEYVAKFEIYNPSKGPQQRDMRPKTAENPYERALIIRSDIQYIPIYPSEIISGEASFDAHNKERNYEFRSEVGHLGIRAYFIAIDRHPGDNIEIVNNEEDGTILINLTRESSKESKVYLILKNESKIVLTWEEITSSILNNKDKWLIPYKNVKI